VSVYAVKKARYDYFSGEKSGKRIKKVPKTAILRCLYFATLQLFSIHRGRGEGRQVDSVQAADIKGHHLLTARSDSPRERANATLAAKQVVNYLLVELVVG
jgi:hypothetical protein